MTKAAVEGHLEMVKLLLDRGADANLKDGGGEMALMRAAEKGNLRIVKVLLDKGADVNIKDK